MSETVRQMFSHIAKSYDLGNRILSFGIDQTWRKHAVKESRAHAGSQVLDCACGTGDLSIAFKKVVGPTGRVVGTDFCQEMLDYAPEKAEKLDLDIEWQIEDVTKLTFEDNTFDIASIAFGIRNVDDPVQGLREMARVVKPGGVVVVLEFGQPEGFIRPFYNYYSEHILPYVGGVVSGEKEAYRYLNRTSQAFPCAGDFINLMFETDAFRSAWFEKLSGGICYLYVATKSL